MHKRSVGQTKKRQTSHGSHPIGKDEATWPHLAVWKVRKRNLALCPKRKGKEFGGTDRHRHRLKGSRDVGSRPAPLKTGHEFLKMFGECSSKNNLGSPATHTLLGKIRMQN